MDEQSNQGDEPTNEPAEAKKVGPPEEAEPATPGDPPSTEELRATEGTELPDRNVMSRIDPDVLVPFDPAVVADVLAGGELPEEMVEGGDGEEAGDDDEQRDDRQDRGERDNEET